MEKLKFLHVGCGPKRKESTTNVFNSDEWEEITLDIDPNCNPNIIGSMTDLSMIEDNSFDAVYSSHNIEHLFVHEAVLAVKEFFRVIKDTGYVMIVCPDIISTCEAILEKGSISGFNIIFTSFVTEDIFEISPFEFKLEKYVLGKAKII